MKKNKVWFVTGASKGLGLSLVKALIKEGYQVAATTRDLDAITKAVGASSSFLPLQMNLLDEQSVETSIAKAIRFFGRIDVVVNNAGYGQLGTIEELTDQEARQNFDVNVFGSLNVIRKIMPYWREQRSGAFFNISSIGGFFAGFPGWGIYCASKFAVAGFTESLAAEVRSFGVSATVVYPGYFKTNFLLEGSLNLPKNPIDSYVEARQLEAVHKNEIPGNQPGDPEKAATALIEVAERDEKPIHLFLGSDAFGMAENQLRAIGDELKKYEAVSRSTDF
ncbi:SDR family NAD(P)-dependent oxidoreductase [Terrimonas sp. NA20]|uniref:SDR family NAD(P)-dependent oxidoreductase n=1 Tax=Terrimonas ginsenosidimutans TaxID=2908004 RepID=A0ABS9KUH7_9BACT|nr:SDR family NAD(P)-dependent oxidoreductase [Terrimonas ginsenosidimutans]MCG2615943.1 SDR family NAD(P)-dependent oxidoreductase [Terrimonas ginsenosidimutans]